MTRKDYIKIANVLNEELQRRIGEMNGNEESARLSMCNLWMDMAEIFKADNPRFDNQRFYAACGDK